MEINRVYRIYINSSLFFEVFYDGEMIFLDNFGNIPEDVTIRVVDLSDNCLILVDDIPYASIDLKNGNLETNLQCIPTAYIRNAGELSRIHDGRNKDIDDEIVYLENKKAFLLANKNNIGEMNNILELHTHFMEVLTGEEFLKIIKDYVAYIDFDENGELVSTYPFDVERPTMIKRGFEKYSINEILTDRTLYNRVIKGLSIDASRQVGFEEISNVLHRRIALIELSSYCKTANQVSLLEQNKDGTWKQDIANLRSEARGEIYFEMLLMSLEMLKKQGVKYVEFSYSNPTTIVKMIDKLNSSKKKIQGIYFTFLYSVHRTKKLFDYRIDSFGSNRRSNKTCLEAVLPRLIEQGVVSGFDLMGQEKEITRFDMMPSYDDENGSLYDKIYTVMEILTRYQSKDLTFRLHAGEMLYDNKIKIDNDNPLKTLEIIDSVVNNLNMKRRTFNLEELVVPPPNIRIGHGLHFQKTERYISLLKKYGVIVEINASSNFALSNIKRLKDIPYNWYLDNGIPIVLSTDGGGFYLTTPIDEMNFASVFGGKRVTDDVSKINEDIFLRIIGGRR